MVARGHPGFRVPKLDPLQHYTDYTPRDVVPISSTDGGYVCIGVGGPSFGKVFVCAMALWDGHDESSGTRFAADSFSDFLNMLKARGAT